MANDDRKYRHIPKAKRHDVRREEFNGLVDILNERGDTLEGIHKTLDLQFVRIAQLQAELDQIRAAWTKKPIRRRTRRR